MSSRSHSPSASAVAPLAPASDFDAQLSALTALSQQHRHLFASPLGPVTCAGCATWLARFVFFGPGATDDSWRLCFLAGFDRRDLRPSRALLNLIDALNDRAEDGHGLNLTFFPLVDIAGRGLGRVHWSRRAAPEIALLDKDARLRGYHGFVRVETAEPGEEVLTLRVREPLGLLPEPDVELISSTDAEPFPVRFEYESLHGAAPDGPLSIAEDLVLQPFELTLRVPPSWAADLYFNAVRSVLGRFVLRYRALQAYGQHL